MDALLRQAPAMNLAGAGESRSRPFDANPALRALTSENTGDTLVLDFFEDKRYTAVVSRVARSYDGITGITARILDSENGFCFISASANGVSVSADLPQSDEQFFAAKRDGASVLRSVKMSKMMEAARPCAEFVPGVNDGKDAHAHDDDEDHSHPANDQATNTPFAPAAPSTDDPAVIDILFLYTDLARQWCLQDTLVSDIDDLIDQALQKANLVFSNSNTGVTVRIAHKYQTNYRAVDSNDDIMRLQGKNDGYMDDVHEKRKQYKADIVMLIAKVSVYGGQGTLLSSESGQIENGFSYCRVQQLSWTYTAPHEIGHNLGCHHHKLQTGGTRGLFTYSNGWRGKAQGNNVSTIMTYEQFDQQGYFPHIPFFSDPQATYLGTTIGSSTESNNTLTIKRSKHIVAAYSDYLNPSLATLSVNPGTLSPAFDPNVNEYTVTVPPDTKSINISATGSYSGAIVSGAGTRTLSQPEHTFTLTVRGIENTTSTYTLRVIRAATDVSLKSLSVSGAVLSPAFSPSVYLYTASVPAGVSSVEILAEADDAEVKGAGTKSLNVGENTFEITVTGSDGSSKIYTLKITMQGSDNAALAYLGAGNYALSPSFSPETLNYSVTVTSNTESVVINASAAHPGATVTGTGAKPLVVGDNIFYIKVTAENGTERVYTLIVSRQERETLSGDATLSSLMTDKGTITPAFSPSIFEYSISTDADAITIYAVSNHHGATVEGTGEQRLGTGSNTFDIKVTAEDGTVQIYSLTVTRDGQPKPSNDATLKSLVVDAGNLSPDFSPGTLNYSLSTAMDRIVISATANHFAASVSGTGTHLLDVGSNTFYIKVTAEDGTVQTYTLIITRNEHPNLSNDATLKSLTVDAGNLTPAFSSGTLNYSLSTDAERITISATANHVAASVAGSGTQSLNVGSNTLEIKVTAEDGTVVTYTIVATRTDRQTASNDATLKSLTSDAGQWVPVFDPVLSTYSLTVDASTVTISAIANHPGATIEGTGTISLNSTSSVHLIKVTAEDGTEKVYYVMITRTNMPTPSNDATLKSLTVDAGDLSPAFSPGTLNYSLSTSVERITISATANHSAASVSGAGTQSLNVGENRFEVKVTAEDGTEQTYILTVTRTQSYKPSGDANLKSLTVDAGYLTPPFSPNSVYYALVLINVQTVTISAEANHAAATVEGTGTKSLNLGSNRFDIKVTAEDGAEMVYSITILRQDPTVPSNDATLKSLTVDAGELTPSFSPGTTNYSVSTDAATINISAGANHSAATVSGTGAQQLNVGTNTFEIKVTAEDGTVATYTIVVIRTNRPTASNDATLKSLTSDAGQWVPTFDPVLSTYYLAVAAPTVTISAIANNPAATVEGTGTISLNASSIIHQIKVTAEDGT